MACCSNPTDDYLIEDKRQLSLRTIETQDSDASEESEILNTDYKKVTPLFRNIERENWEGVLMFLNTGKWSDSLFSSSNEHLRSPAPKIQARTWVTSYDRKGEPEWSQLPIHAAISYLAPYAVVQRLIQIYPKGVHCTDNEGMLPAHLAFGFGTPDNVVALILEPFPRALDVKGLGGRYPYECCDLGPNKARGHVHKLVSEQVSERTSTQVEEELKEFFFKSGKSLGVKGLSDLEGKTPSEIMLDLLRDRKELQDLKTGGGKGKSSFPTATSAAGVPSTRSPKSFESPAQKQTSTRGTTNLVAGVPSTTKSSESSSQKQTSTNSPVTSAAGVPQTRLSPKLFDTPAQKQTSSHKPSRDGKKSKLPAKLPGAPRSNTDSNVNVMGATIASF